MRGPLVLIALLTLFCHSASAQLDPSGNWPAGSAALQPLAVTSSSPFSLQEVGEADEVAAAVRITLPDGASADNKVPAVVLLHGAGGVSDGREGRYARAFAAQGVAAAVIDVFGARGGGGFIERLIRVTEAMAIADAFAVRDALAARPEIDGERIALIGFSYGGMSTTFAAYRQTVKAYGATPFAAHVAFYGPCIARFEDVTTTGAPVLMLWGSRDAIMDAEACGRHMDDLRRGGSPVDHQVFDAAHRWDSASRPWRAPAHIADCALRVDTDGTVRDTFTGLEMTGPAMRTAILAACVNRDGYLIEGDRSVRRQSNAALAAFLNPILFPDAAPRPRERAAVTD